MATKEDVNFLYETIDEFDLSGEDVANLFLNWNGTQIITEEFIQFIKDEGYTTEEEEDPE